MSRPGSCSTPLSSWSTDRSSGPDHRVEPHKEDDDAWIRGEAARTVLRRNLRGLDPVTGRERRRWHPAGTDRAAAQRLAAPLAAEEQGRADAVRELTFGAYLISQWLPSKKLQLAASTYRGYERNVKRYILPTLGRVSLRRLRYHHIEALYDQLLTPSLERPALAPKTASRPRP
jgi:Phage integrase, N-terminal SAM-like domain